MLNRKIIGAVLMLAAVTLAPAVSFAKSSDAPCPFHEHQITAVRSYETHQSSGKLTFKRLQGAEIYVQAEPGLTQEWLQLQLTQRIAQMRASPSATSTVRGAMMVNDCPLDVNGLSVQVTSAGSGFWVKLIARDADHAKEVLRRAHVLFG